MVGKGYVLENIGWMGYQSVKDGAIGTQYEICQSRAQCIGTSASGTPQGPWKTTRRTNLPFLVPHTREDNRRGSFSEYESHTTPSYPPAGGISFDFPSVKKKEKKDEPSVDFGLFRMMQEEKIQRGILCRLIQSQFLSDDVLP